MSHICLIPPNLSAEPSAKGSIAALAAIPGCREWLLEHRELSRLGCLGDAELLELARAAAAANLRCVLVWDLLATDPELEQQAARFRALVSQCRFDAVRAQDPGVARYLRENFPDLPLQLVLETGNHNLTGIQAWIRILSPERVVLSNELPLTVQKRIRAAIDTPVECLVLGRILIFHSPRKLLSPLDPEQIELSHRLRYIRSEEDRKDFPIVENSHGTFMFYEKELLLLPYLDEIAAAGIDWIRLDLRFHRPELIAALSPYLDELTEERLAQLKSQLPKRLTRGFFKSNRTDKQFVKLKNQHLAATEDERLVGTVLETRKRVFLVAMTTRPLGRGDQIAILTPEGRLVSSEILTIARPGGQPCDLADPPGLWVFNTARGVSSGSKLFLIPKESQNPDLQSHSAVTT